MTLQEVIREVQTLSPDEQKQLLKLLVDIVTESPRKKRSILEFEGIAAHLADDEDPQDYVRRIRSEWDERP
jgi:hypothetical protein